MRMIGRTLVAGSAALAGVMASLVVAGPAMAVPGLIVTIDWSDATASEGFKSAQATCPSGTVVLGGGADIVNGAGQARLVSLIPFDNGAAADTFYGVAIEDGTGYAGNWTMYTWAICGSGVSGWQKVSNSATSVGSADLVGVGATCPSGKKVIGAGANIVGNVNFTFLDTVQPASNLASVWAEGAREETFAGTVTVTAHAICINPVAGQQLVSASTAMDSASAKWVSVRCPAGTKLHGTGGSIVAAVGSSPPSARHISTGSGSSGSAPWKGPISRPARMRPGSPETGRRPHTPSAPPEPRYQRVVVVLAFTAQNNHHDQDYGRGSRSAGEP
jgi:hypothetical protein